VCSGFIYALAVADRMVATGGARNALVVGAEIYSRILDWNDRGTCVLFGDGAGGARPVTVPGIMSAHLHADGSRLHPRVPDRSARRNRGSPFAQWTARVFKLAVNVMAKAGRALAANGVDASAVDWFIPHQANIRIMDATAKKLGVPPERMIATVDRHANTSAASIPLALDEAVRDGRVAVGNRLLLIGVGGGFAWGSVYLTW
jgi:3-oxoacyl-[acyl-carrier-protein] synthase-3